MCDSESIVVLFNQLCTHFLGPKNKKGQRYRKYFAHFLKSNSNDDNNLNPSQTLLSLIYMERLSKHFSSANQLEQHYNKLKSNNNTISSDVQMVIKFLTLLSSIPTDFLRNKEDIQINLFSTEPFNYTYFPKNIFEKPFNLLPPAVETNDRYLKDEGTPGSDNGSLWDLDVLNVNYPLKYSWESLGTFNTEKQAQFLTQAGPMVVDMLLLSDIQRMSILEDQFPSIPKPVSIATVFNDIPNLLVGIPSVTFQLIEDDKFILNPSVYLPGITSNFLEDFLQVGSQCRLLEKFIDSPSQSSTLQAFKRGVQEYLDNYKAYIYESTPNISSLAQIRFYLNNVIYQMGYVVNLCRCNSVKNLPQGVRLLNYLYDRCVQGNSHLLILVALLRAASIPYLSFLQKWLFEGVLDDPCSEFPVVSESASIHSEAYWTNSFCLKFSLPFFMEIENQLMACGKSFNLLKLCFPKYYQLLFGNCAYPALQITFSRDAVSAMAQGWLRYTKELEETLSQATAEQAVQPKPPKIKVVDLVKEAKEAEDRKVENDKKRQYLHDLQDQMEEDRKRKMLKDDDVVVEDPYSKELIEDIKREMIEEHEKKMEKIEIENLKYEWQSKRQLLKPKRIELFQQLEEEYSSEPQKYQVSESHPESDETDRLPMDVGNLIASPLGEEAQSVSSKTPQDEDVVSDKETKMVRQFEPDSTNETVNQDLNNQPNLNELGNAISTIDKVITAENNRNEMFIQDKSSNEMKISPTEETSSLIIPITIQNKMDDKCDNRDVNYFQDTLNNNTSNTDPKTSPSFPEKLAEVISSNSNRDATVVGESLSLENMNLMDAKQDPFQNTFSKKDSEIIVNINQHNTALKNTIRNKDAEIFQQNTDRNHSQQSITDVEKEKSVYFEAKPYPKDFPIIQSGLKQQDFRESVFREEEKEQLSTVPFPVLMQRSMEGYLLSHSRLVNKALLVLFFRELKMRDQLLALKAYFLCSNGEFANCLGRKLFPKLGYCQHPNEIINPFILNNILDEAIGSSCRASPFAQSFSFYVDRMPATVAGVLPSLQLKYKTAWPCSLILTEGSLLAYSRVFSFLLQVKRALWCLDEVWYSLRCLDHTSPQCHRLQLYRHDMRHFVGVVHSHMLTHAHHVAWRDLDQRLPDGIADVDEFRQAHASYLDKILAECLLSKRSASVLKIAQNIINVVVNFYKQATFYSWTVNPTTGLLEHPQYANLVQSYGTYRQHADFLVKVLTASQHHLASLLDMSLHHEH